MTPYLVSAALVVLAEMGDKTQLLAVAFACRYPWKTVLWAIFWGSLSNHLLAVLAGGFLLCLVPEGVLQGGVALAFILFGLWTVFGDGSSDQERNSGRGPFMTVFIAFFLAEMGDKTQLTSVALAARFGSLLPVWLGATTGMMIANGLAVLAGSTFCRRLPERKIRLVAALCFMVFGLVGLVPVLSARGVSPTLLLPAGALLLVLSLRRHRRGSTRPDREGPCRRDAP
ncbi:MAG: TMEM165/GDT1 family protein [Synergistaceae bacterium]|nr:TMEM165/GDT1 family protein [Synergistaceae bacterium]